MDSRPNPVETAARIANLVSSGHLEATYKLATLMALIHQATESQADDAGAGLPVSLFDLSDRVIAMYWGHVEPYEDGGPLRQVKAGEPGYILGAVSKIREQSGQTQLWRAQNHKAHEAGRKAVAKYLAQYPLRTLQWPEAGRNHDPFLYDDRRLKKHMTVRELKDSRWEIVLYPGTARQLAVLSPLLCPFLFLNPYIDHDEA